ncbi:hypothetical protein MTO96_032916 [Rhipicephalus appendiculatus]
MADVGCVAPKLLRARHQGRGSHKSVGREVQKTDRGDVRVFHKELWTAHDASLEASSAEGDADVVQVIRHGWGDTVWTTSRRERGRP